MPMSTGGYGGADPVPIIGLLLIIGCLVAPAIVIPVVIGLACIGLVPVVFIAVRSLWR